MTTTFPRRARKEDPTGWMVVQDNLDRLRDAFDATIAGLPTPPTPTAATVETLDADGSFVDTATASTTEMTLYAYTVPGGTMGDSDTLWVTMLGRGDQRSSVLTLRLYWGGVVVFTTTFNAAPSANAAEVDLKIANRAATNSQVLNGLWRFYQSSVVIDGVTASVDTSAPVEVKLTAQWSTLSPLNSYQKMSARTTILRDVA